VSTIVCSTMDNVVSLMMYLHLAIIVIDVRDYHLIVFVDFNDNNQSKFFVGTN